MANERHQKMKALVDRIMETTKPERDQMDRYLKRFKGEWWNEKQLDPEDSRIFVNYVFSTVMTIAPHLTANRLQWSAKSRLPFFQNYINGWKMSADYMWDKEELDFKLLDAVLDSLIMKLGIWKIYFDPAKETGGEVGVDMVDPRDFFIAPGYNDIWETPFCGTKERKPLSWIRENFQKRGKEVKPDKGWSPTTENLEAFEFHDMFANFYTVWFKDDTAESVMLEVEGEEPKKEKQPKFPYGHLAYFTDDVWLEDKPYEYKHGKPPYVVLYDYRIPHQFIGGGEVDQIERLNESLNRNLQLVDRFAAFYSDPPQFMDGNCGIDIDQYKKEYKRGGGVFSYNALSSNQESPVVIPPSKSLNRAVVEEISFIGKAIEEVTGVVDINKGQVGKSQRQSATEIGSLMEAAMTRTRQRVGNLEHFLKRAYYLILSLQMQFYTEPRYFSYRNPDMGNALNWDTISNLKMGAARMVGPMRPQEGNPESQSGAEGAESEMDQKDFEAFVEYTKELGDMDPVYAAFDLEVQTTTTLPLDQQSLANLYLRLLQMAAQNPVIGMPMWKAALRNLRIPGYKEIIDEMQELFDKQGKPPEEVPGPGSPLAAVLQQGGVENG
jgi:hypothetical protein